MSLPILTAVDGNFFLWRAFSVAGNTRKPWETIPKMFLTFVCQDALRLKASHIAVCFDGPNIFRYKVYRDYKSARRGGTEGSNSNETTRGADPYEHLLPIMKRLEELGFFCVQLEEYEADDLVHSVSNRFSGECQKIYIISRDKDLMGSVRDNIYFHTPPMQLNPAVTLDREGVKKIWGLYPREFRDYQILVGDPRDSVPPIPGMSNVKARNLIAKYGTLADYLKTPEGRGFWKHHRETIVRNQRLVRMVDGVLPTRIKLSHMKMRLKTDSELSNVRYIPNSYYELREMVHPRTRSLFGRS